MGELLWQATNIVALSKTNPTALDTAKYISFLTKLNIITMLPK